MVPTAYRTPPEPEPDPKPPADEEARLGALRSSHKPPRGWPVPLKVAIAVALCLLHLMIVIPHVPDSKGDLVWLLFPLTGTFIAWTTLFRPPPAHVDVHERGLVVYRRTAYDLVLFEDVDALWLEQRWVRSHVITVAQLTALRLVEHDGTTHRVPCEVEGSLPMLRWILRHCSDPLLPDARAALAAGETLTFGKVQIDAEGISVRGARARWDEIRLIRAGLGTVALFRRMPILPWRTIELDSIPHPMVFGRLLSERGRPVERDYPVEWEA